MSPAQADHGSQILRITWHYQTTSSAFRPAVITSSLAASDDEGPNGRLVGSAQRLDPFDQRLGRGFEIDDQELFLDPVEQRSQAGSTCNDPAALDEIE